jgi:hypothetical protein
MKYAVLSTDNNPDYYSLLPLVCHSWRKIGYTPVIIFVNVPKDISDIIENACGGVPALYYPSNEGVRDSTLAQLTRLFKYGTHPNGDDILITADADMVIAYDIFTHDVSQGQIVSYGFDLTGRSELPICYVKATAAKWRELMGNFTIPEKAYSERWEDYWSVDQQLLTQRVREYGMDRITFVNRGNQNKHGLPTGRWDRHDFSHIPDTIIDIHMPRNNWDAQYQVAERLWPGEDHSFITKFREALEGGRPGLINIDYKQPSYQELLDKVADTDEHGFLKAVTGNWNNHLPLLFLGLAITQGDVLELGSGEGSTPMLRKDCEATERAFQSFDNNEEWCKKTGAEHVQTDHWHVLVAGAAGTYRGLIFIDHAPGERRYLDAIALANSADVLVLHDTEEGGAGNYMWDKAWPHFKYRLNYNKNGGGAGATLVSNKIDVNRFRGLSLGPYTFDND